VTEGGGFVEKGQGRSLLMRRPRARLSWVFSIVAAFLILPGIGNAELVGFFDKPDTVLASNTVVDIIEHEGGVWFATGYGVNFSMDSGRTWLLYDTSNGLVSDNLSAIYSMGGRIWIATNHVADDGFTISDGLSYSDDLGNTWIQVDFEALGVPYVWGGNRTIFDITGHRNFDRNIDWLFFTAFAGGLLASQDGGSSWRRIFPSARDSINFDWAHTSRDTLWEINRYFSCVTDTSHGDSLYLWTGTAKGIVQYVFAPPREKPFSKRINRIVFCDQCPDTSFVFLAGENGVTRGTTTGGPFIHRGHESIDPIFQGDGLPGANVRALLHFGGRLFAGTVDAQDTTYSTGLAVSDDYGDTFAPVAFTEVIGPYRRISDFAVIRDRLYMAAEEAGLFVSLDTGVTWAKLYIDTLDTTLTNRRNVAYALDALADTLRVGTDSGLVMLYFDSTGGIDSSYFHVFPEGPTGAGKVIRVKSQVFYDTSGLSIDSVTIWTINRPLTENGTPVVYRSYLDTAFAPGTIFWTAMQGNLEANDINFLGDSAFVVSEIGIRFTDDGSDPTKIFRIKDGIDNMDNDVITVMAIKGDTIFIGSDNGFAISNDRGETFDIHRVNTDSLGADLVINFASYVPGINGDWILALGVQYLENEYARVWASSRPTHSGSAAISVGLVTPIDSLGNIVHPDSLWQAVRWERRWEAVYPDGFAWNFAFNGESTFAATNEGLICNCPEPGTPSDTGLTWDTIQLVDSAGNLLIHPDAAVYAVEVIGDYLWVGTEDRTARFALSDLSKVDLTFYVVDSVTPPDVVYAFPVPFSHANDLAIDFHFVVEKEADVTLEVYDFAMNPVKRVIDNQRYQAGIYPAEGAFRPTWDGRNERGDRVAVGVYFFKVTFSTGETRWGKIAVIP
jgi:hypothetical protein